MRALADHSTAQKGLHVLILFAVAVAYPLLHILTRAPAFFIAGKNEPLDLIFLTVALCVLLPAVLILIEWLLGPRRITGQCMHAMIVFSLITAILLPGLKRIVIWPAGWMLAVTCLLALAFTILYFRYEVARSSLTVLFPVLLVVPVLFLFNPRVSRIIWQKSEWTGQVAVNSKNPVIMIIFDEFPLKSLLDQKGNIDAVRFPNFSAFAQRSTWYRNATTVSNDTIQALPAIVTGKYPDPSLLPNRIDYPRNIFGLFESSYELLVFEPASSFSPTVEGERKPRFIHRNLLLFSDLSALYLHYLLPQDLLKKAPEIGRTWRGFWQQHPNITGLNMRSPIDRRAKTFRKFIASIKRSRKPTFYFLHIMIPHVPWQFFPSGTQYNAKGVGHFGVDGLTDPSEIWVTDPNVIQLSLKRHLLQVEFVDRLLGELIEHLENEKLFHRALMVVTADHGSSFQKGTHIREISKENYEDIMRIPLFIKAPFQKKGFTTDVNAQTIDVLPTLLKTLKIDCDWKWDGRSLNDSSQEPKWKIIFSKDRKFEFPSDPKSISGFSDFDLPAIKNGTYPEWIGKRVDELHSSGDSPIAVHLHNADAFNKVDPPSGFIPALVTAHLEAQSIPQDLTFGIVVNGIVRSTARPFSFGNEKLFISTLLPESSFQSGPNEIEVVILSPKGKNEFLRPRLVKEKGSSEIH